METSTTENGTTRKDKVIVKPKGKKVAVVPTLKTRGRTTVADSVISEIARVAASEIDGVFQLGDTGLSGVLGRLSKTRGIDSSVGNREAALTLDIVLSYGYSLREVTENLRRHVIERVEHLAGRNVVSVDINVVDVHVVAPVAPLRQRALE